jgi:thymidylate synthase (FAD)
MKVEMKWITPEAELEIIEIARVSSTKKNKRSAADELLKYLIENKHWSPFEMANMCVEIETSRAIGRQILRHRSFSFQEFSQRYSEVTTFEDISIRKQATTNRQSSLEEFDPVIVEPNEWVDDSIHASEVIEAHVETANILYGKLIKAGVAKEQARMILPETTQTRMYMNGTIRSWLHFLEVRDHEHAQLEVQEIAREIKKIIKKELPVISKALKY